MSSEAIFEHGYEILIWSGNMMPATLVKMCIMNICQVSEFLWTRYAPSLAR